MEQKDIADLIKLLRDDMKPALGVTERGQLRLQRLRRGSL